MHCSPRGHRESDTTEGLDDNWERRSHRTQHSQERKQKAGVKKLTSSANPSLPLRPAPNPLPLGNHLYVLYVTDTIFLKRMAYPESQESWHRALGTSEWGGN